MEGKTTEKKAPWRIVVGIVSLLFIVFLWVKNEVLTIYTTMPKEQMIPMIATAVSVSFLKVGGIAGGVFLLKWIIGIIRTKKK